MLIDQNRHVEKQSLNNQPIPSQIVPQVTPQIATRSPAQNYFTNSLASAKVECSLCSTSKNYLKKILKTIIGIVIFPLGIYWAWQYIKAPSVHKVAEQLTHVSAKTKTSFFNMCKEFEEEIFPYSVKHEQTFDDIRLHSRMHVARSLIFCEVMGRYYQLLGVKFDFNLVRRAIGLHDSGRQWSGQMGKGFGREFASLSCTKRACAKREKLC